MQEIAFFSPNERNGQALYLDVYNADLYWGYSHLPVCSSKNALELRTGTRGGPNGIVEAAFQAPRSTHYLLVTKMSALGGGSVEFKIGSTSYGTMSFTGEGEELPVVAELTSGWHWFKITQKTGGMWFHAITVVEFD